MLLSTLGANAETQVRIEHSKIRLGMLALRQVLDVSPSLQVTGVRKRQFKVIPVTIGAKI